MISEVDKAWSAGIVDGEGSVEIHHRGSRRIKNKPGQKSEDFTLLLGVGNTDARMPRKLYDLFGGNVGKQDFDPGTGQLRMYYWRVYNKRAASILRQLLPYLVTKKEQAELGLEFYNVRCQYVHIGHRIDGARWFPIAKVYKDNLSLLHKGKRDGDNKITKRAGVIEQPALF
jgi:hypothetical protein